MRNEELVISNIVISSRWYWDSTMSFWAKWNEVEESPRYVFVVSGAPYEETPRQARDDIYSISGDLWGIIGSYRDW